MKRSIVVFGLLLLAGQSMAGNYHALYIADGTDCSGLANGGTITTNAAGNAVCDDDNATVSTLQFKTNVADLNAGRIMDLRPVSFKWIPERGGSEDVGFIAEEVQKVMPELAAIDKPTGKLGVKYQQMIPHLLAVIQDHEKRIKMLEEAR